MSSLPDYCTSEYLHTKRMVATRRPANLVPQPGDDEYYDNRDMASIPMTSPAATAAVAGEGEGEGSEQTAGKTHARSYGPAQESAESPLPAASSQQAAAAASSSGGTQNIYATQRLASLKISYAKNNQKEKKPFIIGVCGGSASGKTTVCNKIVESLSDKRVAVISQDSFYRSLDEEEKFLAKKNEYNFDHPDAFDYELFEQTVDKLSQGKPVQIPIYDFKTHARVPEQYDVVMGADVIIIEGILIFYSKILRELFQMKIFVDTDADTRLVRRIRRDIMERGRDLNGILIQYERFVKPAFDDYIYPLKKYADIIVPQGGTNIVAINLLTEHIKLRLKEREIVL